MAEDSKREPIRVKQPGRDRRVVSKPPVKKAAQKRAAKKAPARKKA
jgi:hypothetical protein